MEVTLLRLREMAREDSGKSAHEINCLKQTALKKLLKNPKGVKLSGNNFDYKISYKGETLILRNHSISDTGVILHKGTKRDIGFF